MREMTEETQDHFDESHCPTQVTPREQLGRLLLTTAVRTASVLAVAAVPLTTLALLALVEALVTAPVLTLAPLGVETTVPVTKVLAAFVVLELVRRLHALNATHGEE